MLEAIWTISAKFPDDDEDLGILPCWLLDEPPPEDLAPDEWEAEEEEEWWWPPPAPDEVRSKVLNGKGPDAIFGLWTWDKISRKSLGAYTGLNIKKIIMSLLRLSL